MKNISRYIILFFFALVFSGCQKECFKTDDCNLVGEQGPCRGLHPGFYYNSSENKCVEFIWGGCEGVRPFATMEECRAQCHCD